MSALLALLTTGPGQLLLAAGVALFAAIAGYMRGSLSGAAKERANQAAKDAANHAKDLRDLEDAARAGAAVHPDDNGMLNDRWNRDNR